MKRFFFAAGWLICAFTGNAQTGGQDTYQFLDLPNSARVVSLGGNVIAVYDNDLNLVFHNPSLLTDEMSDDLVLNYINYMGDVNFGYVSYAKKYKELGNFAAGLHYINYGKFDEADYTGVITGEFTAAEYCLNLMYSRPIDSVFTVGANLKTIYSNLYQYNSLGFALDIGATYHTSRNLSVSAVIKNFGHQVTYYNDNNPEPLPFDIQIGVSKKLAHAPFRVIFTAQNLTNFKMRYELPEEDNVTTDGSASDSLTTLRKIGNYMDEAGRHLIAGIEFIPTQNFYIRLGYNYQRRQELKLANRAKIVGFSAGVGFRVSKFHFSYGLASYHAGATTHHISVSTDLSAFYKKQ